MNRLSRLPAVLAYLVPVIGWLYVLFFQRKNSLAEYHLKQSFGLVLFLVATTASWVLIGWILALIPYMVVLGMGLFAIVIVAYIYGFVAWIVGLSNALRGRQIPLPLFGQWANRLFIGES
jgi:uncharacterized membrane protein